MSKPSFRSNAVSKVDLTSTLQRGAITRFPEPPPVERPQPSLPVTELPIPPVKRPIDSRKKKLAHLKTLLEYDEKREITDMLRDIADIVGHNIQFSIFNRGLLLAALAQKTEFLRAAQKLAGLERPSNGDVEAFREYEAQVGQLIFRAFDINGNAPRRVK
ncbi:MAG: hypothetical protein IT167_23185 [Bryobacterales bacterium]|nr:hypothetical protein [Bryobacterales bacterium]